ncbi:MAG: zinc metallopeptidase [Anaerolineales bacterium]|jgi:Zn-dependent membrane protease YugP
MPFLFLDPTYILFMIPGLLLVMIAQWRVNGAYRKWGQVRNGLNMTGAEAAQRLLAYAGISNVKLEGVAGKLTDHFDPRSNTLRLSKAVAQTPSVASMAIAAHEIGHAMQERDDYFPMRFRSALVPMANIGSNLGWILILLGIVLGFYNIAWLGVVAFSIGALFALATLPVEFNASYRARKLLTDSGLVTSPEQMHGVNAVLDAAAMTYVAALATAVLQVLYWVTLLTGFGRRRS